MAFDRLIHLARLGKPGSGVMAFDRLIHLARLGKPGSGVMAFDRLIHLARPGKPGSGVTAFDRLILGGRPTCLNSVGLGGHCALQRPSLLGRSLLSRELVDRPGCDRLRLRLRPGNRLAKRGEDRLDGRQGCPRSRNHSSQEIAHARTMSRYMLRRWLLIVMIAASDQP